ncbi:hypothetical protein PHYSODRAFT_296120 [Phytophthora sojae]|uniref:Uncharacterized protein n=1 Tax=Phytophthora sojae (strain P6497) TaxID=1094619 RepID=G4YXJ0_PHYSP|nr:hypothetical protein PHYSODRAFT_296120 [Phytophthora sojae]EGZ23851.1 hypothetical protein PHYSODRAFT_296120 [Phytophthora sojae]|eukprot:XP_009519139.1 hypothetical protein PHYSODRAFT_296120 [Phytophthora sojae]
MAEEASLMTDGGCAAEDTLEAVEALRMTAMLNSVDISEHAWTRLARALHGSGPRLVPADAGKMLRMCLTKAATADANASDLAGDTCQAALHLAPATIGGHGSVGSALAVKPGIDKGLSAI